jgi:translation initiation factor IF-2
LNISSASFACHAASCLSRRARSPKRRTSTATARSPSRPLAQAPARSAPHTAGQPTEPTPGPRPPAAAKRPPVARLSRLPPTRESQENSRAPAVGAWPAFPAPAPATAALGGRIPQTPALGRPAVVPKGSGVVIALLILPHADDRLPGPLPTLPRRLPGAVPGRATSAGGHSQRRRGRNSTGKSAAVAAAPALLADLARPRRRFARPAAGLCPNPVPRPAPDSGGDTRSPSPPKRRLRPRHSQSGPGKDAPPAGAAGVSTSR